MRARAFRHVALSSFLVYASLLVVVLPQEGAKREVNCHPDVRVTSAREPSAQWKRLDRPLGMLEEVPYRAGCLGSCMQYAVPFSQLPWPMYPSTIICHG